MRATYAVRKGKLSIINCRELMENGVVEYSRESDVALLEPFPE